MCMLVSALASAVKTTMLLLKPRSVMHLQTAVDAHPGNITLSVYGGVMNQSYMLGRLNSSTPCIRCKICNSPEPHVDNNLIETSLHQTLFLPNFWQAVSMLSAGGSANSLLYA